MIHTTDTKENSQSCDERAIFHATKAEKNAEKITFARIKPLSASDTNTIHISKVHKHSNVLIESSEKRATFPGDFPRTWCSEVGKIEWKTREVVWRSLGVLGEAAVAPLIILSTFWRFCCTKDINHDGRYGVLCFECVFVHNIYVGIQSHGGSVVYEVVLYGGKIIFEFFRADNATFFLL